MMSGNAVCPIGLSIVKNMGLSIGILELRVAHFIAEIFVAFSTWKVIFNFQVVFNFQVSEDVV